MGPKSSKRRPSSGGHQNQTNEAKPDGSTPEDAISINDDDVATLRRSSRVRKKPAAFDDNTRKLPPPMPTKRKASPALDNPKLEDPELPEHVANDIIAASLEPWKENELEEWDGWAEVESNPQLFTAILRKLGVKDARIEDVLSIDELPTFPPPVHGLVFLHQYKSMHRILQKNKPDTKVWFAKQIATNACGTIALMNIIMNAKDLTLGDKLSEFKEQSKDLVPALRGHMIATSTFIRAAHNMHNSRMDLLHAVRGLEDAAIKSRRARAKNAKRTASSGRRRSGGATSTCYHFVAFVPIGNGIWHFDGLDNEPGYVCDIEHPENWLEDIEPIIQAYATQKNAQNNENEYNLMALCGGQQDNAQEEADAVPGRQNHFSSAIHEWVKRLAERGKLQDIVHTYV
ncbi:hypothetical protein B0T21DRAFT_387073 [Apiosordaria backusii]|uniref:Ubiquitin carboxyl-terminal hydrolase n=1 Tax=Apiosordaria backusii TaxID=314023 RepID=A0AA40DUX2_9PEZI|nr:hypothetical protein B0T21DRAFT_387073 [Apiosordaria backusii]